MKKTTKYCLVFALIGVVICLLFGLFAIPNDTHRSSDASVGPSGLMKVFDRLVGSAPSLAPAAPLPTIATQNAQTLQSTTTDKRNVCDLMAADSHDEQAWKKFDANLHKKLNGSLPELAKLLARAAQSQSPIEKASALYLTAQLKGAQAVNRFTQNEVQCEANEVCRNQMLAVRDEAARENVNEIAKMAIYSSDPKLYMMAFNACNSSSGSDTGYCAQIDARQWASRDPNNGMAWLHVLTKLPTVSTLKSSSEVDEALFRISQAKYFDGGFSILSNLKDNPDLRMDDIFVRTRLKELASFAWDSTPLPSYVQVVNSCKADFLNNPNRRQTCNEIGQKWQREDALAIELPLSAVLGKNLSWEPTRVAKIQDEWDAISGMMILERQEQESLQKTPEVSARQSCRAYLKHLQDFEGMVTDGELKQLRKNLAAHSKTPNELAAIRRAEREKMQKEAVKKQ